MGKRFTCTYTHVPYHAHTIPSLLHTTSTLYYYAQLQGKQLKVYTIVCEHLHVKAEAPPPLLMIVSGTAGTGKSYLINCLRLLLQNKARVAAPTGVAAFNVDCHTIHSLLSLHTKENTRISLVKHLQRLQHSLADTEYLVINEMFMVRTSSSSISTQS